jgi:tRNA-dihydrouridine synthase
LKRKVKPGPVKTLDFPRRPILNGKVNFPLCLAPMVGLSHMALRLVARDYLPVGAKTLWPTEMLNSRRIPHEDLSTTPEAFRAPFESELVPQILGNEEGPITESVRRLTEWGAEGIDINMGCPVQKALKHNYGVALMGDPEYAANVVRMTKKNSRVPVSVKLRAGRQGDFGFLRDFVHGLIDGGADWVTLHPRTAEQKRRGSADWEQIRRLREEVSIPVIGNGDIQTSDDVFRMLEETGCDMVMAGRALAARPWMLWQVGEDLGWPAPVGREGPAPRGPLEEGREYGRSLKKLLGLLVETHTESLALRKFRFHVRMTCGWLDFGHSLFAASTKAKNAEEVGNMLDVFFKQSVNMSARTELRE